MDHFPMLVAQHLKLDVARMLEEFLRVNVRRAKGLLRFAACRLVSSQEFILFANHAHAAASFASCSSPSTTPSLPGIVGRPAVFTSRRARSFSPIISMISGRGPIKVISDASQTLAKLAFSERNPYPGWMASTFVISAALITWGMFR